MRTYPQMRRAFRPMADAHGRAVCRIMTRAVFSATRWEVSMQLRIGIVVHGVDFDPAFITSTHDRGCTVRSTAFSVDEGQPLYIFDEHNTRIAVVPVRPGRLMSAPGEDMCWFVLEADVPEANIYKIKVGGEDA